MCTLLRSTTARAFRSEASRHSLWFNSIAYETVEHNSTFIVLYGDKMPRRQVDPPTKRQLWHTWLRLDNPKAGNCHAEIRYY